MKPRFARALTALLLLLFTLGSATGMADSADSKVKTRVAEDTTPYISQKAYDAALALRSAGKYTEAEQALRALVEARTQALGSEARETLLARNELVKMEIKRGKNTAAESQMQTLLPILQRVLGAEARETLNCRRWLICQVGPRPVRRSRTGVPQLDPHRHAGTRPGG
jgi:hypothetical protein